MNWLTQFAQNHNRVLLYSEQIEQDGVFTRRQRIAAYGPPEFQREMADRFANGDVNLGVIAASPMETTT